jgi:hypothetical protein
MNVAEINNIIEPSVFALAKIIEVEGEKIQFHPFCSGICVDPSGIFISAKQRLGKNEEAKPLKEIDFYIVKIWIDNKNMYNAIYFKPSIILASLEFDIAAMKIPFKKGQNFAYIKMPSEWNLTEGEEVRCFAFASTSGRRLEVHPNMFIGCIHRINFSLVNESYICNEIILNISSHEDISGGPVFNLNSELIAIVSTLNPNNISNNPTNNLHSKTNLIRCVPYTIFNEMIDQVKTS